MSDNSGACQIVKFVPQQEVSEELQNFAEEFFDVIAIDYTDDGLEQLVGYMPLFKPEDEMQKEVKKYGIKLPAYFVEKISSADWLTENVIKFSPVIVDDFVVYGIHEKNIDTKGKIGVKVYAATAFGSEHQTTKSCLRGISEVHRKNSDIRKVLDVGTGSGVLAIAAAKLWPKAQIVAVDIDAESVAVAQQNAEDNGVSKQISVALSDGYQADIVTSYGPYDLILANILARPLIAMAQDMSRNLQIGGYAIISGFIDNQVDWVVGAHEKFGLKLVHLYEDDNWRAALLEKIK